MGAEFKACSVIGVEFVSSALESEGHLGEFDIFRSIGTVISVVGLGVMTGSSRDGATDKFKSLDDVNIDEIKEKLKGILEPAGLWKESKFGLYAILGGSY